MEWVAMLCLAICVCLAVVIVSMLKQIKKINSILDEIIDGELDRRIVIGPHSPLAGMCYKINQIMMNNKERLIHTKRLERRNDKLMTSLAHDIRTPLTSIIGNLDAIHYQFICGDTSKESIESAREKAYVLKSYLDDLFQWFKLNSKEEKVELQTVELVEETRVIFANWIASFEGKGMAYDFIVDKEEIFADIDHIFYERAVNNLLKNVLEHSEAERVWVELDQTAAKTVIRVCDNGQGIKKEEIPFVFDRLYKEDSARSSSGSGLGLAITKELVQLQGGKISVESVPFRRMSFTIEFPRNL